MADTLEEVINNATKQAGLDEQKQTGQPSSYAATTKSRLDDLAGLEEVVVTGTKKDLTVENPTEIKILRFPSDVGVNGVPYVLLKIFEIGSVEVFDQTTASLRSGAAQVGAATSAVVSAIPGGETIAAGAVGAAAAGLTGALVGVAATTETGQNVINQAGNVLFGTSTSGTGSIIDRAKNLLQSFALKRNVDQQKIAIGLFMPEGINTSYDNEYETLSVTATLGLGGFAAQALAAKKGGTEEMDPYIGEMAATLASKLLGGDASATKLGLFATTGRVVNPQLEMIYTSPVLRRFVFDFRMIPKNRREAADIQTIIYLLKLYSAPKIPDSSTGRYFIPPAQFEIEFYDGNGNLNDKLFRTKKCVLTGLNLDYAPNGFATFDDGMPVETRMQLTFQETAIIDRNSVAEGY
jgi:hypothetical protein